MDSDGDETSKTTSPPITLTELMVSFVAVIITVSVISVCIGRWIRFRGHNHRRQMLADAPPDATAEVGMDEAAIESFPRLLFSEAKVRSNDRVGFSCSVCLCDYNESDVVRLLPGCRHFFHLECVDSWLRVSATCPLCRSSPKVVVSRPLGGEKTGLPLPTPPV